MCLDGEIPKWDLSEIRPAGSRLKVFGGRASGPGPLDQLFKFTVNTFKNAYGRKLNSLECHDIICKIGEVVVVGGVRRAALISLSNLSDQRMRDAKSGEWWNNNPQRALANNSAAYTEKPEVGQFMEEWLSLYNSKSGERGIFNRIAAYQKMDECEREYKKGTALTSIGLNPCAEIILKSAELCNLSEVVARESDTREDIFRKIELATILGTIQSSLTNFPYVRKIWQRNCEDERLLGVSITGIMDCPILREVNVQTQQFLRELRAYARDINVEYADILGIQPSKAVTAIKPSGTVSQLVDSASGIHQRHSEYYIRNVRNDKKDPLTQFMIDAGVPHEQDVMNDQNIVFSFPIKAPNDSILRDDIRPITHLEIWKMYRKHYCDHNPSVTISVREEEWPGVGSWVWNNFDEVCGLSFLPYSEHIYQQAPYQECSENEYLELVQKMPDNIDWEQLIEEDDETTGSQEYACVAGSCEI